MDNKTLIIIIAAAVVVAGWLWMRKSAAGPGPKVAAAASAGDFRIVEFATTRCPVCPLLKREIEKVNDEAGGKLNFEVVYLDEERDRIAEARAAGIGNAVPFWVVYAKDGKVLYNHTGALPAAAIKKVLLDLGVLRRDDTE